MNAMIKSNQTGARSERRTIVSRDGKVLVASYTTQKQAKNAAATIARRHAALEYLAKR
ncbi:MULTISPECIES: hypothetical protein [Stenotrophomonas maltophilia group]|uniref:hypothetical protein n=1 Tax=Stenotrophomonas maltophilia group TaxID=995085 RepID=UPI001312350C|nr:hypothetical protein [Stenotrophomonas maltophilia]